MKRLVYSTFVLGALLYPSLHYSFQSPECSQSKTEREHLMRRAEKKEFTLRRVEFLGLTYTRDDIVRSRVVNFYEDGRIISFNEGDLFSRRRLVQSLKNVSKLGSDIYPVSLKNVSLRLNESDETVDIAICFKEKRR